MGGCFVDIKPVEHTLAEEMDELALRHLDPHNKVSMQLIKNHVLYLYATNRGTLRSDKWV